MKQSRSGDLTLGVRPPSSISQSQKRPGGRTEGLSLTSTAQALGPSLDEIRGIIDRAGSGIDTSDEVRELVRRRVEELDERLREMRRYRCELKSTLEGWDMLGQVEGHVCGLIEGSTLVRFREHRTEGLKKATLVS